MRDYFEKTSKDDLYVSIYCELSMLMYSVNNDEERNEIVEKISMLRVIDTEIQQLIPLLVDTELEEKYRKATKDMYDEAEATLHEQLDNIRDFANEKLNAYNKEWAKL